MGDIYKPSFFLRIPAILNGSPSSGTRIFFQIFMQPFAYATILARADGDVGPARRR